MISEDEDDPASGNEADGTQGDGNQTDGTQPTDSDAASPTRVAGVEFGPLKDALCEHQYPVTTTELIEVYGGFELSGPEGTERVEEALGRVDENTFRTPSDVRDAIVASLTGRKPDAVDTGDWTRTSV